MLRNSKVGARFNPCSFPILEGVTLMFNAFYCGQGLWDSTSWLERTGSDQVGINKMKNKANIIPIFCRASFLSGANTLEARNSIYWGEAAVHKYHKLQTRLY